MLQWNHLVANHRKLSLLWTNPSAASEAVFVLKIMLFFWFIFRHHIKQQHCCCRPGELS